MTKPINILLIEDNPGDVRLVHELLRDAHDLPINLTVAPSLKEGLRRLATDVIQVILLDLNLPDSTGLSTFSQVYKQARETPVIIMSILEDKETIYEAMQLGAQNYLIKGRMEYEALERAIRYALWSHTLISKE